VLLTIFGLSGTVLVQDLSGGPATDVAIVESGNEVAAPQPAPAPARVVESAGFPAVPTQSEPETATGPTVTINGRPLDSSWSPATDAVAEAQAGEGADATTTDVALVAPRPIPRPEGLSLPSAAPAPATDYEAITAAAYPQESYSPEPYREPELVGPVGVVGGFMTYEERQRLAAGGAPGPNTDELVQVIGPNGEVLWVYPDQASQFGYRRPAPVGNVPFGILFE